jgi:hypothetical protein
MISLYELRDRHALPKGWQPLDPQECLNRLVAADALFVHDSQGRIICFVVDSPWFSDDRVVSELWVDDGIALADVVLAAKAACVMGGAGRFVIGTRAAANDRHAGLAKLYSREGLTVSTVELEGKV